MGLERLPEHFKIKEDEQILLTFYYFDERKPSEKSGSFTNLSKLVKECKKYAEMLNQIESMNLPEGFRIDLKIDYQLPTLYFNDLKIKAGDIFELKNIANKNHVTYRQVTDLNNGVEVEL